MISSPAELFYRRVAHRLSLHGVDRESKPTLITRFVDSFALSMPYPAGKRLAIQEQAHLVHQEPRQPGTFRSSRTPSHTVMFSTSTACSTSSHATADVTVADHQCITQRLAACLDPGQPPVRPASRTAPAGLMPSCYDGRLPGSRVGLLSIGATLRISTSGNAKR